MAVQTLTDEQLHEINQYSDTAFPVGLYVVTKNRITPKGRGYMDLHWHEELQFTLVTNGSVTMQVSGEIYKLQEGEAIFINRNLLHITSDLTDDGRYVSIDIPERMLGFFAGSRMEQNYVQPYTGNYLFQAIVFKKEVEWQKKILDILWELEQVLAEKPAMFEYDVSVKCVSIWQIMIQNLSAYVQKPNKILLRKQERIRTMLTYIHENYMNHILLQDIANQANISVGECCRCFKNMISESPNQYLMQYRISRAREFLNSTELSVTEVAMRCGFNDTSHFIQYFKMKTGLTPFEYRKSR